MSKNKKRRTVDDAIRCGNYIVEGYTILDIEKLLNIPHSTVHWLIHNKVKEINPGLYEACAKKLISNRGRKNGGAKAVAV